MDRFLRKSTTFVFAALVAVSSFAQSRSTWRTADDIAEGVRGTIVGTVTDTQEGRGRLVLAPDDDKYNTVIVDTDSLATQYNGFGGTINGSPEIFVGSTGFSNVRVGDRLEVRGIGRASGNLLADHITLLGRIVAAPQTGVGQTRPPSSVSTPTAVTTTPTTAPDRFGRVEGVVRQVSAQEGRLVIETAGRQLITIRAASTIPVYYKGDTYRTSNLEVGDRIRITPQSGSMTNTGEINASTIDVVSSVQDTRGSAPTAQVGNLSGRVVSLNRSANTAVIDTGRGNVTIDLRNALDDQSRRVRAADLVIGDQLDLSGNYAGDTYVATTVRFLDQAADQTSSPNENTVRTPAAPAAQLVTVTVYGTIAESLRNSPQLVIRDQNGGTVRVNAVGDFAVRTRAGGYTTANRLTVGEAVAVRAYQDGDGNLIAQTIRIR